MSRRIQSVTTAHAGRSADLQARQRRYLAMMAIRIACVPFAIIVEGWARWIFIAGAVVLPYIAVVVANAVNRPRAGTLTPVETGEQPALEPGPADDRRKL
ncbi:MAG: DUF3099 domain-containing protein [Actinomycetota bacterium]